ncbi:MAG: NAD(P)H-hydrate dehydratase [Gammaproteobacteria bacterium]
MAQQSPFSLPGALYRAQQVREIDRRAIQERGIAGYELMRRAGQAAFAELRARWPAARRVVVVCGGGNNGGDGFVVARLAQEAGLATQVLTLADPARLSGDARTAYDDARQAGAPSEPFAPALLTGADVIVDAIFGIGLEREVSGHWRAAIDAINATPAKVLALDIPSGLHADRGAILGAAVRADLTVCFIALKQGLFTGAGPDCNGEIVLADLAIPADLVASIAPSAQLYGGENLPTLLPKRMRSAHKGDHGHVLVVGGDQGMAGAARMAAEAAARCGAGLVSVATHAAHAGLHAALRPELMFRGVETAVELSPLLARASVIAVGPGLGTGAWGQLMLNAVLEQEQPLVIDADALNLIAKQTPRTARPSWVLTPHPGEAARLLGIDTTTVQTDRFAAAERLAQHLGGVVVLKGAGTLIASADQTPLVCHAGNPGMASGGMGDVLTGVIAGLLAQGLTPWDAARAGVYLHARAGDLAALDGERGLLATDLLPWLRKLVNP